MELYNVFIRILKSLNCYSEYKNNFKALPRFLDRYNQKASFKYFVSELLVRRCTLQDAFWYFINDSFSWERTPQGHNFWSKMNSEFRNIANNSMFFKSSLNKETYDMASKYIEKET